MAFLKAFPITMFWKWESVGSVLGDPKNDACLKFEFLKTVVVN